MDQSSRRGNSARKKYIPRRAVPTSSGVQNMHWVMCNPDSRTRERVARHEWLASYVGQLLVPERVVGGSAPKRDLARAFGLLSSRDCHVDDLAGRPGHVDVSEDKVRVSARKIKRQIVYVQCPV